MAQRIAYGIMLALALLLLVAVPALATYYAYIYIEEENGNSYTNLPMSCTANITQLASAGFISATGLDTRVLTGDGEPLPHMLANDRIMFVSDLAAYEDKTLIFYTGATSLSSFPIVIGQDGYITTDDDPDLELSYVLELVASGYFDASSGAGKNILYKQDAFKMNISAVNTLRVAALEAGDVEQWEMHYSSFTSGEHTVYVMANGLVAYLYVDTFDVAKDTANLFDTTSFQCINKQISARCFYDEGYYWVFYYYDSTHFAYVTSPDGLAWSGETTIALDTGDGMTTSSWDIKMRDEYIHFVYTDGTGTNYLKYRRGDLTSAPGISWSAAWQQAATDVDSGHSYSAPWVAIDSQQYPYIAWEDYQGVDRAYCTKSANNDGTWSTAGGYPFMVWSVGSNNGVVRGFLGYPSSDKLLLLWEEHGYDTWWDNTYCNYYNGSSWETVDDISAYITDIGSARLAADDNDNMYIGWGAPGVGGDPDVTHKLTVRHDGEVWETITVTTQGEWGCPHLSYNENNNVLYILYGLINDPGTDYVYCVTLDTDEMELNAPVQITTLLANGPISGVNPYEDHIGFIMNDVNAYHSLIDLTAYQWGDNANDWVWMMNDCMPYADYFQLGVDGIMQLEYQPETIIEGDTLPDISDASGHDGTITWGTNPDGVTVSISSIQTDEEDDQYSYYPYIEPGSQDIIKPEPAHLISEPNLDILRRNPLYPLVATIVGGSNGQLTLSLVWIGLAMFVLIAGVVFVLIKSKYNITLTCVAGLGLSILFYTVMPILPLAVTILFAIGALASFIHERMPSW